MLPWACQFWVAWSSAYFVYSYNWVSDLELFGFMYRMIMRLRSGQYWFIWVNTILVDWSHQKYVQAIPLCQKDGKIAPLCKKNTLSKKKTFTMLMMCIKYFAFISLVGVCKSFPFILISLLLSMNTCRKTFSSLFFSASKLE